jgi:hypothetical protein
MLRNTFFTVPILLFAVRQAEAQTVRTLGNPCQSESYVTAQLETAYEDIIKQRLKAPTTAKFDDYEANKEFTKGTSCIWNVTAAVTSQNSFGAMLTERMQLMMACDSSKEVCMSVTVE